MLEIVAATLFKIISYYIGYIYKSFLNETSRIVLEKLLTSNHMQVISSS